MGELPVSAVPLVDAFARVHRDLRVSLTDRCNLRCTYCMPEDFAAWTPSSHLLSREEIVEVISVAVDHGVSSVRLTGGEPLLHPQVVEIVRDIAALPNAPRIALTTNGLRLERLAQPLADAGLERVNVSLDTLQPERFLQMTKRDRLHDVLVGIKAAQAAGLAPVKVNAVLLRGVNDDEAAAMLDHALVHGWGLRFIEQMPLDAGGLWSRAGMVTAEETLATLGEHFALTPLPQRGPAPAEEFWVNGGPETVGIIASVTRPFCGSCDRLRVTADGQVRNCLFAQDETDLRAVLRDASLSASQRRERLGRALLGSVAGKKAGHGINDPLFLQPARPMSAIGG